MGYHSQFRICNEKELNKIFGTVTEILGVPKVLIEKEVIGQEKPKKFKIWCACLVSKLKSEKEFDKAKTYMKNLLIGKRVYFIQDPFMSDKQGYRNAHIYLKNTNEYINETLLENGLVKVDNSMRRSKYYKRLKSLEREIRRKSEKKKNGKKQ